MSKTLEKFTQPKLTQSVAAVDKGPLNLPASWYIAMHSKDLDKKPIAIELFGRPLVAWRDQNQHPVIMEPYCSHKGANLTIGKVVDGCIQCPFHHWRYDSSGKCVFIPDVEHIPSMARQATYVTAERYDCIWVWYGSQTPLFPLPEFSAAEDERHEYILRHQLMKFNVSPQEAVENPFDYSHLMTVHKMKMSGPFQFTLLHEKHSVEQGEPPIQKDAWFGLFCKIPLEKRRGIIGTLSRAIGLSAEFSTVRLDSWPHGFIITNTMDGQVIYKMLSSFTPVSENKTHLISLFMYKKTGKFLIDRLFAALIDWRHQAITAEDAPIWSTIKRSASKVHVKDDWLILKYRSFYKSWVDKVE